MEMKLCIADPPYLGRAVRYYGEGGCGEGNGKNQADNHPMAHLWDDPKQHKNLIAELNTNYDCWAIALTSHSLSTYLEEIETDSRNGIRVCVWHKPSSVTSGSRITNSWEPVIIKVHSSRRGWKSNCQRTSDVLVANPARNGFMGAKPKEWTYWVLDLMGYQDGDEIIDMFIGSGAVTNAIESYRNQLRLAI